MNLLFIQHIVRNAIETPKIIMIKMLQTNQMLDNRLSLWRSDKYIQLDERLYMAKRIEETTERNYIILAQCKLASGPFLVVES